MLLKKLAELEKQTTDVSFWDNSENSSLILKEITNIKTRTENYKKVKIELENIEELNQLLKEEKETSLEEDLQRSIKNLEQAIEKLEINTLLADKYDKNNAIITLHPGAGGTESQDWAEMLYRMYTRWAIDNGYTVKELDYLEGEEAGIKSVTALIEGNYAYGYLKG